jgi:hypothetical protein
MTSLLGVSLYGDGMRVASSQGHQVFRALYDDQISQSCFIHRYNLSYSNDKQFL